MYFGHRPIYKPQNTKLNYAQRQTNKTYKQQNTQTSKTDINKQINKQQAKGERQTDRQTEPQTDRQRQRQRETDAETDRQTDRQTESGVIKNEHSQTSSATACVKMTHFVENDTFLQHKNVSELSKATPP